MKYLIYCMLFSLLFLSSWTLVSCQRENVTYSKIEPAHLEPIPGKEFNKLILTPKAVSRLGIEAILPTQETLEGGPTWVIPYSAVIYGPHGQTWIYTNPKENVFVREEIAVDRIEGGSKVYIKEGLKADVKIVISGSAELYGTEYQVGH